MLANEPFKQEERGFTGSVSLGVVDMNEKELFDAVGRSLYWNYTKRTSTATPRWVALKEEERALWRAMARTAHRKIQELAALSTPPTSA